MRKQIHLLVLFIALYSFPSTLKAVKADPTPITITQSNGSQITYQLRGDEFFHYKTTIDGYPLVPNTSNILTYAQLNATGDLVSTNVVATETNKRSASEKLFVKNLSTEVSFSKVNSAKRAMRSAASSQSGPQQAYPLIGTPKSLVILVNFKDIKLNVANDQTAFTNLLNLNKYSANGGTGSARDYFRDNSSGVFNPEFEVVGPYTLPENRAYYGGNNSSGDDTNPRQMVIDACNQAYSNGVDFSKFDTDGNGTVDNVFIYYAGYNEAESGPAESVWPHRWNLGSTTNKFNNKTVYDYACTSELRSNSGTSMCGIGTFVHEFGHVLGLPDYYATNDAKHFTLSYWSVMDSGPYLNSGRTPPSYSAYDRFYLNWLIPTELKTAQNVTIEALNTSNKAYIVTQNGNHNLNGKNPNSTEFFTVENRQKTGWDTYLLGHGLLITRINYNQSAWNQNGPNNTATAMGVDIMEADGVASSNSMSGDPFPGTANIKTYSPTLQNGTDINKPLSYITETAGILSFRFMGGGDVPRVSTKGTFTMYNTIQGTPSATQTIKVSGKKLETNLNIGFESGSHFDMKINSEDDTKWRKSIQLVPVSSIVDTTIVQIRYNPIEASFADTHSEAITFTSTNADATRLQIFGKSSRPIYVVSPTATEAAEVNLSHFIAKWNKVYDASGYYFTAYGLAPGTSEIVEDFKNGLTAPGGWTISASFATTSSMYSGKAVPAIQFVKTGDYIQTQEYAVPATELSFFVQSKGEIEGSLNVEGWNGTAWKGLDNIPISSSLSKTKTYTLSRSDNYTQFKLSFVKGSGDIIIDDLGCKFADNITYLASEKWVTANSDTLENLVSNRTYFYKVKASDKTLNYDKTIKYENITNYSNLVEVKTAMDTNYKVLRTNKQPDGTVTVILPDLEQKIQIYNSIGKLVMEISPKTNVININTLPIHQVYIFKAGDRISKVVM